jgi:hypothetical protein
VPRIHALKHHSSLTLCHRPSPLKVKVALRDHWEKADSPLQKSIQDVKALLGLDVYCEPQWPIIISDLEKLYDDKGQLTQAVIGLLHTWFVTIAELMDDESHEAWSENVVEKIREFTSRLKLNVEVSPRKERPWTHLSEPLPRAEFAGDPEAKRWRSPTPTQFTELTWSLSGWRG